MDQLADLPRSVMRPSLMTRIWSAWVMVESRWATIRVVRPADTRARESCRPARQSLRGVPHSGGRKLNLHTQTTQQSPGISPGTCPKSNGPKIVKTVFLKHKSGLGERECSLTHMGRDRRDERKKERKGERGGG